MQTINDVHQQFAGFFRSERLRPFAYLVSRRLAEGHICVALADPELQTDKAAPVMGGDPADTRKMLLAESMVGSAGERQPFILHNDRLYLHRYFAYESAIVGAIKRLVESEQAARTGRIELLTRHAEFIRSLASTNDQQETSVNERTDWQQAAAILGVLNNFTIITGGPGTGKTTTVARVLAILLTLYPSMKCALAAPTGKAAVRVAESLKASVADAGETIREKFKALVPTTIHRLLRYKPGSPYFRHDKNNPLVYDLVIVDEASMIDAALFAKLLDAIAPGCRIILLGDKNQLASVEAGSLLGDLCQTQVRTNLISPAIARLINSFIPVTSNHITDTEPASSFNILSEHIIEFKRSHRFTSAGGIGKFSRAVVNSALGDIGDFIQQNNDAEITIDTTYSEALFNKFIEGYTSFIQETDIGKALFKLNHLRLLCAMREGPQGLSTANQRVETWLSKKGLIQAGTEFYEHRPIIVTRNYPELGLFNGDVGIIRTDPAGNQRAWFEDSDKQLKQILPGYITSAETVFAMTIHKSQGSEYDNVLVLLPDHADQPLLTRELLYTAVTRAKKTVLLQASESSILYTAGRTVQRASGIMERFAGE
jgi:exodeoxyribonuclease V alpha subunit